MVTLFNESLALSLCQSDDLHPIDLDDAWQWLGYTEKRSCLDTLKNNFVLGEDFLGLGSKSNGGRPSEVYLLSVDCFKTLGMMAGTKQGKVIRGYFLKCERELKDVIAKIATQLPSSEDKEIDQLRENEANITKHINELKQVLEDCETKREVIRVKKAQLYIQKYSSVIEEGERCKQIIASAKPVDIKPDNYNPFESKLSKRNTQK